MAPEAVAAVRADWRPSETDRLLLQALLLPDQPAQAAWQAWAARVQLDDVGGAAFHLLPALYQRLADHAWPSPDLARLKGISRKTWYENQMRQSTLQALLAGLSEAGITPLLLRGAIPSGLATTQPTTRDNGALACAVAIGQAQPALEALTRLGWQTGVPGARPLRHWPYLHGLLLCPPLGTESVRLEWRLPLGEAAGQTLPALPYATDQLWLACLDGVLWRAEPDWRWLIDAVQLIHANSIDWAALVQFCRETATILPVRDALGYMVLAVQAPIPAATLAELHTVPTAPAAARQFALISRRQGRLGMARHHWLLYRAMAAARPSLPGFVRYLEAYWSLGSGPQVLLEATKRGWTSREALHPDK